MNKKKDDEDDDDDDDDNEDNDDDIMMMMTKRMTDLAKIGKLSQLWWKRNPCKSVSNAQQSVDWGVVDGNTTAP